MSSDPLAGTILHDSQRAPVVQPQPAPAAIQAERQRLAALRRTRKAERLSKGMS